MKYLVCMLLLLLSFNAAALEVPSLTRPVEDLASVISLEDKAKIETSIRDTHKQGLAQISVLIIPSLEDEVLEEYSIKVAESWKLGSAEKDNGVLVLIAMNDRKIRVEVGNGIEGELTDYDASRIIDGMKSYMRSQDYGGGVFYAVERVKEIMLQHTPEAIAAREEQEKQAAIAAAEFAKKVKNFFYYAISSFLFLSAIVNLIGGFNGNQRKKLENQAEYAASQQLDKQKQEEELKAKLKGLSIDRAKYAYIQEVGRIGALGSQKNKLERTLQDMKEYLGV